MTGWRRPIITLGFCGGAAFGGNAALERGVTKARDLEPWLKAMGELEMIGDIRPVFISADGHRVGTEEWADIGQTLKQAYRQSDGIVIIHDPLSLVSTAVAVGAMVRQTGKPIVLSPGRIDGPPSGRSNLINALQTAASDLSGVFVVAGNQVLSAPTFHRTNNGGYAGQSVGKIDFGIRLFKHQSRKNDRPLIIKPKFKTDVQAVTLIPGGSSGKYYESKKHPAGVILISDQAAPVDQKMIDDISKRWQNLPVVLVGSVGASDKVPVAWVRDERSEAGVAAVRLMWATAQGGDWRRYYARLKNEETSK